MRLKAIKMLLVTGVLIAAAAAWTVIAQAGSGEKAPDVKGAGTTMLEGGTGPPSFTPVITKVAFHWSKGRGSFECLALAPSASAGSPGSGNFDTNAMYVTGEITSARIRGQTATLRGTATVTGLGAGSNLEFTAKVTRGGPGATLVLEVSGLTFEEILLEGQFRF